MWFRQQSALKAMVLASIATISFGCSRSMVTGEGTPAHQPRRLPSRGVIVMAHGGNEAWNQDVEAVVAPLRETFPVSIAYGMADTATIRAAVRALEDEGVEQIAVVRLFVSGDSFKPETEYILNLRPDLPDDVREANLTMARAHGGHGGHGGGHGGMEPAAPIGLTARVAISGEGLIDSDLIGPILADRVRALSVNPSNESVLLIGHGPGDDKENERWLAAMERHARDIRALAPFRAVYIETLREDWPEKRSAAEERIRDHARRANQTGGRLIVVPYRLAGFGPYEEVLEGVPYRADGRGFCPHPNISRWIKEQADRVFARLRIDAESPRGSSAPGLL